MALYVLGSMLFVVVALWMALDAGRRPLTHFWGWVGVVFFGLCFVLSLRETVSPRMGLRLDAEGIHSRQAMAANSFDLPWSQLTGVRVMKMNSQPMVVFDSFDPEWGMAEATPGARRMRAANSALVGSWMVVAPSVFGADAGQIVDEVDRYYRHYVPTAPVEYPRPG